MVKINAIALSKPDKLSLNSKSLVVENTSPWDTMFVDKMCLIAKAKSGDVAEMMC